MSVCVNCRVYEEHDARRYCRQCIQDIWHNPELFQQRRVHGARPWMGALYGVGRWLRSLLTKGVGK